MLATPFWVKKASEKVVLVTVEKLIPENMGVAVGILTRQGASTKIQSRRRNSLF